MTEINTSPTTYVLTSIAECFRDVVLMRTASEEAMKHVVVKLPADVFDRLRIDVLLENDHSHLEKFGFKQQSESFTFMDVRYERNRL